MKKVEARIKTSFGEIVLELRGIGEFRVASCIERIRIIFCRQYLNTDNALFKVEHYSDAPSMLVQEALGATYNRMRELDPWKDFSIKMWWADIKKYFLRKKLRKRKKVKQK